MRNAAVTHTDVHWYRERTENNTEWVLTYDVRNITQRSPGFTDRFQSCRDPSNNSFILTITNVQPNDTGVYYCKVWGDINGNGSQLTVMVPAVEMNRELWIVWISVGAAVGVTVIAGAALLFCIRCTRPGKQSSSSPQDTREHSLMLEYENISDFRNTKKPDDVQVDANQIYMNVPSK
ncbi:sodium channel subunit beta-2-like [Stegostoma tigrinum]|uniref:sodium channel subunit beta-2-like n=1 Tax=Stegostoma tigrinum TaxID=3053191 RepID=UPI00202AD905|nr:sodium channel subunit beta-2-like [Stegostoma tigrinum]